MPRFTVDLAEEIDARLTLIASEKKISKAEAMRRAFALLSIAYKEGAKGNALGVVREEEGGELKAIAQFVDV